MYQYAILVFLGLAIPGFGKLPTPTNVTIDSVNFKNILRWNPPPGFTEDGDVKYTVQYQLFISEQAWMRNDPSFSFSEPDLPASSSSPSPSDFKKRSEYSVVCVTQHLQCDLTYITYIFYARVSAAVGDNQSDWVTIHFDPYLGTVITPPEVLVSPRFGHLDISISGPYLESNSEKGSIKEKYGELIYRLLYWKEEDPSNVLGLNTSQSSETLTKLEPWSRYCLKVQAYFPENEKEGQFSPIFCGKTTDDGRMPWWQVAAAFLIMMLVTMTATLGFCFFGITAYRKYSSFPSYSIPEHLKEYLSKPFNSTPNLPTQPSEECGESCEQLTFLSEESEETKEETNESA